MTVILTVLAGCSAVGESPVIGKEVEKPYGHFAMCIDRPYEKLCKE